MMSYETLKITTLKLLEYCQANNWAGYDPYDALNSPIFKYLPFLNSRWPRIAFTQLLKRSPVNFRPLLLIPKTENPKAIALFLMAFLKLKRLGLLEDEGLIPLMIEKLINLRSPNTPMTRNPQLATRNSQPGTRNPELVTRNPQPDNPINPYCCWGYSFPWQTRTILVPRGAPNLVCTIFVANALLDAYEITSDSRCLDMAISAADYVLDKLYWTDGGFVAGFSYPLSSLKTRVHNANFLGAALLCRIYKHSGDKRYLHPALKAARYSAAKQHDDGSWDYGELPTQQWIDNFHTGYNLCALQSIGQDAGTTEFEPRVHLGFEFYRKHFFREDGAPKYFDDRPYPIDVHSVSQSIITLVQFRDVDVGNLKLAESVLRWAMTHLWNKDGFWYYQMFPPYTIRIPYMRWSQTWMLLALSTMLSVSDDGSFAESAEIAEKGSELHRSVGLNS